MKNINSKTLELEMTLQCHFQQSQFICYMGFKKDRKGVKFIYAFPEIWTSWLNLQNCYIFTSLGQKTETIGNILEMRSISFLANNGGILMEKVSLPRWRQHEVEPNVSFILS